MGTKRGLNYSFSIRTLGVAGIGAAFSALRLPYGLEVRSGLKGYWYTGDSFNYVETVNVDEKDLTLLSKLVKGGDEEGKVTRGIVVWCEIEAPRYWWQEADTYGVGAVRMASNSTLHQQCRGMSTQELIDTKEHLEEGTIQKRVWMYSYQTLRRIYKQRHNHRLPHWWDFCEWIESLPYAEELILVGLERRKQ